MSSTQQLLLGEGAVNIIPNYIEEVFSTYLYNGTGAGTNTITNGIDLSTKGGMVWIKSRTNTTDHKLTDTVRGVTKALVSNTNAIQTTDTTGLKTFSTTGFAVGASATYNSGSYIYSSWTFREQPKFFDVVTYSGDGVAGRTVAHNLGSVPGCIIVKRLNNAASNWVVYHRSNGATPQNNYLILNDTLQTQTALDRWNNTAPTSTVFTVGDDTTVNDSSSNYVAYLFAHDAGGFGLTGTDNVISCGSYTGNAGTRTVTLGYEPQWIMIKRINAAGDWAIYDNMRGMPNRAANLSNSIRLIPNLSDIEAGNCTLFPNSTGFTIADGSASVNASGGTYIYMTIRRGPMKVPTLGTSVFATALGVATTPNMVAGFPVDSFLGGDIDTPTSTNWKWWDRLRGNVASLLTTTTAAEDTSEYDYGQFQSMTGFISGNYDASDKIGWMFRRAPSFFDEVCYTGTGANRTVAHNLAVVPELMIIKARIAGGYDWMVYQKDLGNTLLLKLNETGTGTNRAAFLNSTTPTASVFTVGTDALTNVSGGTFVSYLFATCAGVSKVGSYTGTATTLQIDCGFTAGARFVMIKRTDSTGDWYVWDSARGIIAGNDPYLLLNSTAAQVTNTDYVDTYSAGFEISSTAPAAINASGGTYIFLAIA
jgi:hypothetical protein